MPSLVSTWTETKSVAMAGDTDASGYVTGSSSRSRDSGGGEEVDQDQRSAARACAAPCPLTSAMRSSTCSRISSETCSIRLSLVRVQSEPSGASSNTHRPTCPDESATRRLRRGRPVRAVYGGHQLALGHARTPSDPEPLYHDRERAVSEAAIHPGVAGRNR